VLYIVYCGNSVEVNVIDVKGLVVMVRTIQYSTPRNLSEKLYS